MQGIIDIDLELVISVQQPNPSLYEFEGFVQFMQNGQVSAQKKPIDVKNFLFKGAMIRNVKWVLGVVIYTGTDSKIQQNGAAARFKISSVEKKMHKMIIVLFLIQVLLSIVAVIIKAISATRTENNFDKHLMDTIGENDQNLLLLFIRYFILLSSLIPISLIVNLEMVRLTQAYFIIQNMDLANKSINRQCKVSTTTINEELGQIEYVLTDKTGTLTQNKMILRGLMIADKLFGGSFSMEKNGEKTFTVKSKTDFDTELEAYLRNSNKENMPYPMDICPFKLQNDKPVVSQTKENPVKEVKKEDNSKTNSKLTFMENTSGTFLKPQKINVDNQKDGLDEVQQSNLRRAVKRRETIVINQYVETSKQRLAMNSDFLADLYPEENLNFIQKTDHETSNSLNKKEQKPTILSPNKIKIIESGDQPFKNQKSELEDREDKDDEEQKALQNKKFFEMPQKDREYPRCNFEKGTVLQSYTELTREFMTCAALCHELLVEVKKEKDGTETKSYQGSSPDEIAICLGAKQCGIEFLGTTLGSSKIDFFGDLQSWEVLIVSFMTIKKKYIFFQFNKFFRLSVLTVQENARVYQ